MGKVNVIIVDATGNKEQKVGLPDDIKCGIIMVKLVEKIKLPSVGPDGNPISYKFIHKVSGRQLLESQTLAEAGVKDGDVLRLQPEITAGATCPNCGAEMQDGISFCSRCGSQIPQPEPQPTMNQDPNANPYSSVPPTQPYSTPYGQNPNPFASMQSVMPKAPKSKGKLFGIGGIISGLISVIMGFVVMGSGTGSWEASNSYGGDAYTGIQNAAAQTANNVQDLAEIAAQGFGWILVVLGLAIIFFFAMKMASDSDK